jgi:hypothetical protein
LGGKSGGSTLAFFHGWGGGSEVLLEHEQLNFSSRNKFMIVLPCGLLVDNNTFFKKCAILRVLVSTLVMKTEIFHLDSLQNKHILKNVMAPSVRMLYPDGIIQFQQDHSSIRGCRVVQEWLSLQADIELTDWPP